MVRTLFSGALIGVGPVKGSWVIGKRTTGLLVKQLSKKEDKISIHYFAFLLLPGSPDGQIQRNLQPPPPQQAQHVQLFCSTVRLRLPCVSHPLDLGLKATLDEAPDSSDGPRISLMFPPVYEGDEAGRVQTAFCSSPAISRASLQPRLLEAEPCWRPLAWVGPQKQADEVPGRLADTLEVIPGEAEVQPADVQAGLLCAFVKEGRGATQQHVRHHAQAPQVRGQRHRVSKDQLWGSKLRAAQQRVAVVGTVELDGIAEVCEFDHALAAGAVGDQQVLRLGKR